ncbi:hypothetical protein NIES4071_75800 [Calothrix sp. NIES-4071]|nr:hypothetical protein NIES4071_75800 [Calothrix sp. NIES-4071]BAZ61855.1 hypothetical protein NIES4105_75750 [Calothrix sp. NIES-4105]
MHELEMTVLKRSQYLAASLLELKVLGKLYGIKPAGNDNYKINWVDNLVAFMPQPVRIWNLGFISNESKHCLAEALDGCDLFTSVNTFNHPSIMEKAIIGRLIFFGCNWRSVRRYEVSDEYDEQFHAIYSTMRLDEEELLNKYWSIYQIKQMSVELHWLFSKYWRVDKPNDSIQ